jgi:hypothetical protein
VAVVLQDTTHIFSHLKFEMVVYFVENLTTLQTTRELTQPNGERYCILHNVG